MAKWLYKLGGFTIESTFIEHALNAWTRSICMVKWLCGLTGMEIDEETLALARVDSRYDVRKRIECTWKDSLVTRVNT